MPIRHRHKPDPDLSPRDGSGYAGALNDLLQHAAGPRERAVAFGALVSQLAGSAKAAGTWAVLAGRWLGDVVTDTAPQLVIRDADTLRRHYAGLADDAIAGKLISNAARVSAAIGAGAGAMAAVEFTAPPALAMAPVQLAAETLGVVAVEIRLVAELHALAGLVSGGRLRDNAPTYVQAWVQRRAVSSGGAAGMGGILGHAAKRELRKRMVRKMGRSVTSLAPFLAGAAASAEVNRRATRDLGETLRAELRAQGRFVDIVVTRLPTTDSEDPTASR